MIKKKVETIGDAYMAVGGAPVKNEFHSARICDMALDMVNAIQDLKDPSTGLSLQYFSPISHISPSFRHGINYWNDNSFWENILKQTYAFSTCGFMSCNYTNYFSIRLDKII